MRERAGPFGMVVCHSTRSQYRSGAQGRQAGRRSVLRIVNTSARSQFSRLCTICQFLKFLPVAVAGRSEERAVAVKQQQFGVCEHTILHQGRARRV